MPTGGSTGSTTSPATSARRSCARALAHGHRRQPRSVRRLALSGPGDDRALPDDDLRRRAALSRRRGAGRSGDRAARARVFRALSCGAARRDRAAARRATAASCSTTRIRSARAIPRLFEGELPLFNLGTNRRRELQPGARASGRAPSSQRAATASVIDGRFKGGWITRAYGKPARRRPCAADGARLPRLYDDEPPTPALPRRSTLAARPTTAPYCRAERCAR